MPQKEVTEADLRRVLTETGCGFIALSWMRLRSHTPRHTSQEHMDRLYDYADVLMQQDFDGFIVTGAPVEHLPFRSVDYWPELCRIMDWAHAHVRSTLYLCWGAMAALWHFHGIDKQLLPKKLFGVFQCHPEADTTGLLQGLPDPFPMPHSRHTSVQLPAHYQGSKVSALATSPEAGLCIAATPGGREVYAMGHLEYAPDTLDREYHRDLARTDVELPKHYYANDDPSQGIAADWQPAARRFYANWLNLAAGR